jgi:hypothetical protein
MAEMRNLRCPACDTVNQPFSLTEGVEEYRCRGCGVVYCGPCGCDTVHDEPVRMVSRAAVLPSDWQMTAPAVAVVHASSVAKFPGCS